MTYLCVCVAVLDHRKKCGAPSTPGARAAKDQTSSEKDDSLDGLDASNDSISSFAAIMSEGESSSSEGEVEEEDKDTHSGARERFIEEAKERQSFDQHSTSGIDQTCTACT